MVCSAIPLDKLPVRGADLPFEAIDGSLLHRLAAKDAADRGHLLQIRHISAVLTLAGVGRSSAIIAYSAREALISEGAAPRAVRNLRRTRNYGVVSVDDVE